MHTPNEPVSPEELGHGLLLPLLRLAEVTSRITREFLYSGLVIDERRSQELFFRIESLHLDLEELSPAKRSLNEE